MLDGQNQVCLSCWLIFHERFGMGASLVALPIKKKTLMLRHNAKYHNLNYRQTRAVNVPGTSSLRMSEE